MEEIWQTQSHISITLINSSKQLEDDIAKQKNYDVCKKSGHGADKCWFREQGDGSKKCFKCGESDHMIKDCPIKDRIASTMISRNSTDDITYRSPSI